MAYLMNMFSLSQDKFIQYLLAGTKRLSAQYALNNNNTISHIINCSTGILLLSMNKCDIETNPNPTVSTAFSNRTHFVTSWLLRSSDVAFFSPLQSLFEEVFEIFRTVSILVGSATSQRIVIRHLTGTIYQSR